MRCQTPCVCHWHEGAAARSMLGLCCRLRSKEGYQEFLKTLNLYGQDIITRSELVMMVQDILARFTDIAVSLNDQICILEKFK